MDGATMTQINYAEYNQLQSYDQALVWAITTLEKANHHPENSDLMNYVTIRPEARDFVAWDVKFDGEGQPFLSFSMLFPLSEHNPLLGKPALPLKIPTYTDFQPDAEPLSLPANGQGLPVPPIPTEIDTLERLACWLGMIGHQLGEFLGYCSMLQGKGLGLPSYTIDARGLLFDKPISLGELLTVGASLGTESAEGAAAAFDGGDNSPVRANNDYLAERISAARDSQAEASEPPQINPGKGYDRIDTLPQCRDQDPSLKAFNKPLRDLLK
jgi:hypothetical protein